MKKAFHLTNKYIVLSTPLVLFAIISGIYLIFAMNVARVINMLFLLAVLLSMAAAFFAGWGNMLKNAVLSQNEDESHTLIKEFIPGVGEYFMPVNGALCFFILTSVVLLLAAYFIGAHFIGTANIPIKEMTSNMSSQTAYITYLKTLSYGQLVKLELWTLLILCTISISHFLMLLYLPIIFFKEKNPFFAFLETFKETFSKKFLKTLGIYLGIFFINFALTIICKIFDSNQFGAFVAAIFNFYFVCFAGVWIFSYYYDNFVLPKSDI